MKTCKTCPYAKPRFDFRMLPIYPGGVAAINCDLMSMTLQAASPVCTARRIIEAYQTSNNRLRQDVRFRDEVTDIMEKELDRSNKK